MHNIWNFWADKYDKLWVQKYSLKPTRKYIRGSLSTYIRDYKASKKLKLLDLGCGPGQLISELSENFSNIEITGLDFSEKMLQISKKRNPSATHIQMEAEELNKLNDKYNIIVCTHSLPYYKEPRKVFSHLYNILSDEGKILIAFASGESLYDKFVLAFVKLTTGKASYPSDSQFKQLIYPYFYVEKLKIIREKSFMPRIALYTLSKVKS
jgi:ubiquinone/menaquinone biosynthesis C-methylase UbiE